MGSFAARVTYATNPCKPFHISGGTMRATPAHDLRVTNFPWEKRAGIL